MPEKPTRSSQDFLEKIKNAVWGQSVPLLTSNAKTLAGLTPEAASRIARAKSC